MFDKIRRAEAAAGLAAKAGSEIAHAEVAVAIRNMLIALCVIPVVPMAHVNTMVTLVLLTALVLALVVGYVCWKFMNRRETRKPGRIVSIEDARMFWNSHYSRTGKSYAEEEKRAS